MMKRKGHYLGTEIDQTWWKRYMKDKLFARGTGEYWFDDESFYFRRYLTKVPIMFHFKNIVDVKTGHWHAGRWVGRNSVIKLIWEKDGVRMSSGFVLSRDADTTDDTVRRIQAHINTDDV